MWFFIHDHQRELGRRITTIPRDVMDALEQHDWPGNVRELENVIERALIRIDRPGPCGSTRRLAIGFRDRPAAAFGDAR